MASEAEPQAGQSRRLLARLEGERGEAWVGAQAVLLLLAAAATFAGPRLPDRLRRAGRVLGLAALGSGGLLFLAGLGSLGRHLTPLPRPRDDAALVRTGAYRVVRHPIYSGGVLAAFGWALVRGRWLGLAGAIGLLLFFDAKASREEIWLSERFPEYPAYRRAVRKLIPGLY